MSVIDSIGPRYEILLNDMGNSRRAEMGDSFARKLAVQLEQSAPVYRSLPNLKRETGGTEDKKMMDVCYEMESLFIGIMLKSMRNTVQESDFFGQSLANDIFRDMLYDEYAKMMARSDQFGIARQIYDQLRVRKTA
jgi:flagellar protein FlgJ